MNLLTIIVGFAILGLVSSKKSKPLHDVSGGFNNVSVTDPEVLSLVYTVLPLFNQQSDNIYYLKVKEILRAQRQAVNGYNYLIDVVFAETRCLKPVKSNRLCYVKDSGHAEKVQIESYVRGDHILQTTFTPLK